MKIYAVTGHRPQSIPNYSFTRLLQLATAAHQDCKWQDTDRALWEKLIFLADKIVYNGANNK